MINLIRHQDFFDPLTITDPVHVVGVGAVGSHIATFLARLGIVNLHLWDFDKVDDHNIPNQMYREIDINKFKTKALKEQLLDINPDINIKLHKTYKEDELKGYVFVCVDNIEIRKSMYVANEFNVGIKAIFDTRIGLDVGQVLCADWHNTDHIEQLLEMSDFTHDEVEEETTACGSKLAVLPTVILAANIAVVNLINFKKHGNIKLLTQFNSFNSTISR